MVANGTALERVIDFYYSTKFDPAGALGGGAGALGGLFMHSLFAVPVAHYAGVIGRRGVRVVLAGDLDVRDPVKLYETLNQVFSFVGVCPVPISDLVPSLGARNTVPYNMQMSQDMHSKLTRFFSPFNDLLTNISSLTSHRVNVSHWSLSPPPAKLPPYSSLLNASHPRLWFEPEEQLLSPHLSQHLLPQRTSPVDSSYNTTLGMLNTF
ncbi:hypothetical protein B484DRAFT_141974 [Ochromonadaceae sp. CCMP2298]|nr:hypothetical protein B484DRAFT_141974 [Ochromonadaceae sp. CCMP2298]